MTNQKRRILAEFIHRYYSLSEVKTLLHTLGVHPEDVGGMNSPRDLVIWEVVGYFERRGRLAELGEAAATLRPQVADIAPPSMDEWTIVAVPRELLSSVEQLVAAFQKALPRGEASQPSDQVKIIPMTLEKFATDASLHPVLIGLSPFVAGWLIVEGPSEVLDAILAMCENGVAEKPHRRLMRELHAAVETQFAGLVVIGEGL